MKTTAKVLAVRRLDFTTVKEEKIQGRQLWACAPTDDPAWNGHEVLKIWVPDTDIHAPDCAALIHGDTIEIDFNRRGKPFVVCYTPEVYGSGS